MRSKVILIISILALVSGCAADKPAPASVPREASLPAVTIPNGSSPDKANAPRAPMNDDLRTSPNHGNGVLWVYLEPLNVTPDNVQKDGSLRVKLGWWREHRGKFTIDGRRLDAPAPALRYLIHPESYGDFGFLPSYLYFSTEGYWEITGRIDDQSLTFVVHVVKT